MSQQTDLAALFRRDLTRLVQEIEAYPEDLLWKTCPGVTNSAGNLTLHLEGNLRHFVGFILGGIPYSRQRDLEFSSTGIAHGEILTRIRPLVDLVPTLVAGLSDETLQTEKPGHILAPGHSTYQFLLSIFGHLSYHLGQIDYLRRTLSGNSAIDLAAL